MNRLNLQLFYSFFKIGAFTFGGGWAMIALIEKDIVDTHKWLTKEELSSVDWLPADIGLIGKIFVLLQIVWILS